MEIIYLTNLTKAISKNEYTGEIHTGWSEPYIKVIYENIQGTLKFLYAFNGLNKLGLKHKEIGKYYKLFQQECY